MPLLLLAIPTLFGGAWFMSETAKATRLVIIATVVVVIVFAGYKIWKK